MGLDEAAKHFERFNIDTVLLAISNASFSERKQIIDQINHTLNGKSIPSVDNVIENRWVLMTLRMLQLKNCSAAIVLSHCLIC